MLIFGAKDDINQRALVNHVFEPAAGIPTFVPGVSAEIKSSQWPEDSAAGTRSRQHLDAAVGADVLSFDAGSCIAAGAVDHPAIPSNADPRPDREQVGDLVIGGEMGERLGR